MNMKEKYKKENFSKLVKESKSFTELREKLNICRTGSSNETIKKYIHTYNLDTTHFDSFKDHLNNLRKNNIQSLESILIKGSTYLNNTYLKIRLVKNNLLEYKCSICNNRGVWQDKKMALQLDHINGINNDNRIENLRFLCPNCHSQTNTFSGKNNSKKIQKKNEKKKNNGLTEKQVKNYKKTRKIDRPKIEQLLKEVSTLGYKGTGRKYGVSDNAVRKWIKWYEKRE